MRVPFIAPNLTKWFVLRPREFEAILSLVLARAHQNPEAITTALHGAGGYGKTTLAADLCHDDRVIEAFDGSCGHLGSHRTSSVSLAKAYQALWGEQGGFVDGDHGERKLAEKLSHVAAE